MLRNRIALFATLFAIAVWMAVLLPVFLHSGPWKKAYSTSRDAPGENGSSYGWLTRDE